jgi:hypothetical protein
MAPRVSAIRVSPVALRQPRGVSSRSRRGSRQCRRDGSQDRLDPWSRRSCGAIEALHCGTAGRRFEQVSCLAARRGVSPSPAGRWPTGVRGRPHFHLRLRQNTHSVSADPGSSSSAPGLVLPGEGRVRLVRTGWTAIEPGATPFRLGIRASSAAAEGRHTHATRGRARAATRTMMTNPDLQHVFAIADGDRGGPRTR